MYTKDGIEINPFSVWREAIGIEESIKSLTVAQYPLEQLWVTQDETEYLFYQMKHPYLLVLLNKKE